MEKIHIFLIVLFVAVLGTVAANNVVNLQDITKVEVAGQLKDYYLEVARGNVEGQSSINKFGHNPAATPGDDIWGGGGSYNFYPTTAQSMEILSTDADDTSAGSGARTIIVYGLDENWEEQSEVLTLNGGTPVNLTNTYIRMFRAVVLTAGTTETNEGALVVRIQGGGTTAIFIGALDGQTQHTIYTIPAGKTGYFIKGYVALADDDKNGEVAEFQWQARPNNGVTGAWAVKGEVGLNNIGTSAWIYQYGVPAGPLPPKTDIRIRVVSSTATLGVVGGYDLVLIDNE
jgi:hypothetical protein